MHKPVKGFSKLTKEGKIAWIANEMFANPEKAWDTLQRYWHPDAKTQKLHDDFIENTISNYYLPFGVAPNFLINGKHYTIPMAIEESSVVAAASKAAQFWMKRGGFKTTVISTTKIGHVHFIYTGDTEKLHQFIEEIKPAFFADTDKMTANMRARGGGVESINLIDKTAEMDGYFQLEARFETCDSMGANFINSCLEQFAKTLEAQLAASENMTAEEKAVQIVMCILSNYTPECLVRAEVSCPIADLNADEGISPADFATKFMRAVRIAEIEPYRATTHNKGIMNGIDAVVLATGNDFRAVEAACHTHAARSGKYTSLTHCKIENDIFTFWIEIPLSLGVVGGLTSLHPLVKFALEMLGKPSAEELMGIIACSGLAQNFGALRALTTTGIQKGHMKMHLFNILTQLDATEEEKQSIAKFFTDKVPHHSDVVNKFCEMRGIKNPSEIHKEN